MWFICVSCDFGKFFADLQQFPYFCSIVRVILIFNAFFFYKLMMKVMIHNVFPHITLYIEWFYHAILFDFCHLSLVFCERIPHHSLLCVFVIPMTFATLFSNFRTIPMTFFIFPMKFDHFRHYSTIFDKSRTHRLGIDYVVHSHREKSLALLIIIIIPHNVCNVTVSMWERNFLE